MEAIQTLVDFILHLDTHLTELVSNYGGWTYAILFLIVFAETGLVVTPFLPGDSLLFATGALAATSALNIWWLFALLLVAAIVGDAVNYAIGARIGTAAAAGKVWGVKPEYIQRTHEFYEKYGGKTIIIARFVPIVRTFAPFVAGAGSMTYRRFAIYNVSGALLWVGSMLFGGYWFGNLPIVRDNFGLVVIA
ncbi:MAG TPA: DedA family protein, partial [Gemmatimonadales bacterium]|nr:DedA family protein [Gemmatimonadales bacterium]